MNNHSSMVWETKSSRRSGKIGSTSGTNQCFTFLETVPSRKSTRKKNSSSQVSQVKTAMPATAGSPCCRFSRGLFSLKKSCSAEIAPGRGSSVWIMLTVDLLVFQLIYPLVNIKNYGKSPFLMGKLTITGVLLIAILT